MRINQQHPKFKRRGEFEVQTIYHKIPYKQLSSAIKNYNFYATANWHHYDAKIIQFVEDETGFRVGIDITQDLINAYNS